MNFLYFAQIWYLIFAKMKRKLILLVFEFESPISYPTTIIVTLSLPCHRVMAIERAWLPTLK